MDLRDVSWRLAHLIVELMRDAPLNKKLLYAYFNDLIELDEKWLPEYLAQELEDIKLQFNHPQAVTVDKLSESQLLNLAKRIVLLLNEVSYYAGIHAQVLDVPLCGSEAVRDEMDDSGLLFTESHAARNSTNLKGR